MALFWCTEALPLAVTALLPVLFFPLMGIMDSTSVCKEYLKDTNMLFLGGLLVAIAVEHCNLHKRIALRVLLIVGVRPALLLMGFMGVTAFLSMWISNTATTAMMVPIAQAVLDQLHQSEQRKMEAKPTQNGSANPAFELQEPDNGQANGHVVTIEKEKLPEDQRQLEKKHRNLSKGMSLSVCYSSSIGGLATLTGTTPNLVLKGQMDELFPDNHNVVNFASWFGFAFPTMVILLVLSWFWLMVMFLGFDFKKNFGYRASASEQMHSDTAYDVIRREHRSLGPMKFSEGTVLGLFIFLVLLWFTREPGFMPSWANALFSRDGVSYVTDATVVIFIALLMFFVPSEIPRCGSRSRRQEEGTKEIQVTPALLDWPTVHKKMPWNIIILLGGGFALAKGSEVSGLSEWLGSKLTPLQSIPHPAIVFLLCLLVAAFTECTSNVATTTLFLPILASMAQAICLNPLYVMLPCTLAASLAFMLPVATAPNAIVFSYGQLRVMDMVKAGCMLNLLGVLTITFAINTWAFPLFDLHHFPSWANGTNGQC
ncbi:solute carrier family 13 member 2 [Sceloporus undulatus]|uniref:solute carrier family 13 member 2 n=1 Tax=Sceloporus undulatus TaxID=8520 RepID=UPI001C4B2CC8|nr:solute carrier family 13 member 2 [Sceloporus undulatus]